MLPDWVSNPRPLTYESGALPIALRGPAPEICKSFVLILFNIKCLFPFIENFNNQEPLWNYMLLIFSVLLEGKKPIL